MNHNFLPNSSFSSDSFPKISQFSPQNFLATPQKLCESPQTFRVSASIITAADITFPVHMAITHEKERSYGPNSKAISPELSGKSTTKARLAPLNFNISAQWFISLAILSIESRAFYRFLVAISGLQIGLFIAARDVSLLRFAAPADPISSALPIGCTGTDA